MDEGGVDDAVGGRRAAPQAVEVFNRAAMHRGAGPFDRSGGGIGAGEAEHLVARGEEVLDDGGADEAGGACHENTHEIISIMVWMKTHIGLYLSG